MLEIKNIQKKFCDGTAVKGFRPFNIRGEFVVLLGPSGSGKLLLLEPLMAQ